MPRNESPYPRDWLVIAERYPFVNGGALTVEEVARSRDQIGGLVELIRQELL